MTRRKIPIHCAAHLWLSMCWRKQIPNQDRVRGRTHSSLLSVQQSVPNPLRTQRQLCCPRKHELQHKKLKVFKTKWVLAKMTHSMIRLWIKHIKRNEKMTKGYIVYYKVPKTLCLGTSKASSGKLGRMGEDDQVQPWSCRLSSCRSASEASCNLD